MAPIQLFAVVIFAFIFVFQDTWLDLCDKQGLLFMAIFHIFEHKRQYPHIWLIRRVPFVMLKIMTPTLLFLLFQGKFTLKAVDEYFDVVMQVKMYIIFGVLVIVHRIPFKYLSQVDLVNYNSPFRSIFMLLEQSV